MSVDSVLVMYEECSVINLQCRNPEGVLGFTIDGGADVNRFAFIGSLSDDFALVSASTGPVQEGDSLLVFYLFVSPPLFY